MQATIFAADLNHTKATDSTVRVLVLVRQWSNKSNVARMIGACEILLLNAVHHLNWSNGEEIAVSAPFDILPIPPTAKLYAP